MAEDTGGRVVSLMQDREIRERARSMGCTEGELREALKAVANLISLEQDGEICDWAMSLGCTEAQLRAAVKAVGSCSAKARPPAAREPVLGARNPIGEQTAEN